MSDVTSQISLKLPRLWARSTTDRYAGGVLGGIAAATSTDVGLLRGITVGIALWSGASGPALVPVAYLALWLLLPTPSGKSLILRAFTRPGAQEIAAAVLATLVVVFLSEDGDLVLLALLGLAGWLLADTLSSSTPGDRTKGPDEPPGPEPAVGVVAEPATEQDSKPLRWGRAFRSTRGEEALASEVTTQRDVSRRREPALWPLAAAALMLWLVGTITADGLMEGGLAPGVIVSGAIVIVGAVLTLSAWRGRAGVVWLALPPLLLLWLAFSAHNTPRNQIDGTQVLRPAELADGETLSIAGGYGEITLDLRAIDLKAGDEVDVDLSQTAGSVSVLYPYGYRIRGQAAVGLGTVILDYHNMPLAARRTNLDNDQNPDAPTINLDIEAGLSSISIWTDQRYRP